MKSGHFLIVLIIAAALFAGCEKQLSDKQQAPLPNTTSTVSGKDNVSVDKKEVKVLKDVAYPEFSDDKMLGATIQRMIVKTGTMNLEVDKYDDAESRLNETVKKYGGYVSGASSNQNTGGKKSGTITLKVPVDKYDAFVSEVSGYGKVLSTNIQARDVTEEYVDLETRLKTQKELEERLLKLLNDKTSKLSDVIEIEEKLANVRQKIEGIDAKMKVLKSQSDMSTLTVSVYEPSMLDTSSGGGFFYELGQSVKKGLKGFTSVLGYSITILIALIPVFIFVFIVVWLIRKFFFRRKKVQA
ncbi:MAG: DUF4349 domain-containing protein [Bacteroidetes bacterium]|nr:DUF4349 domain-containing protein [Bacteroidota bacterium]